MMSLIQSMFGVTKLLHSIEFVILTWEGLGVQITKCLVASYVPSLIRDLKWLAKKTWGFGQFTLKMGIFREDFEL